MSFLKPLFLHLKRVCIHKYYVGKYLMKCGFYKQAITHDLSKFSYTEISESIQFYEEGRSPIDVAKERQGYSLAWLHHRGRNKHHNVYWTDNYDQVMLGKPLTCYIMPFKYAVELVCDYIGASIAYNKNHEFVIDDAIAYWEKLRPKEAMHPAIKGFVTFVYQSIKNSSIDEVMNKRRLYLLYVIANKDWDERKNSYN